MGMKNQESILGCREKFGLTPSEFLFLWYLAYRGHDEDRDIAVRGEAWPGQPTIKKEIGLDVATTRKTANRLEELKILTTYEPGYKGRKSTTYIVDYAWITAQADNLPVDPPGGTRLITGGAPGDLPGWVEETPGELPCTPRRSAGETYMEPTGSALKKKREAEAKAPSAAGALASASPLLSEETNQLINLHKLLRPGETDYDRVQFNTDNPLYTAHVMIWAYTVSHYKSRLNGIQTFIKALPTITSSYEKYMLKLSPLKPRPEEAIPTLEGAIRFAEETHGCGTPHEYAAKKMKKKNGGPTCERAGCPNATETDAVPAAWSFHLDGQTEKFYLCRDCKEALDAKAIRPVWDGFRYQIEENYDSIDLENL